MIDLVKNVKPISYVKAHTTEVIKNVGEDPKITGIAEYWHRWYL